MSGDVQPRKRKDKRRKRDVFDRKSEGDLSFSRSASFQDDDESSHGVHITKMGNEDVHLHVQHEHGTGGHWCAKVIFFALMSVLLGLVGLIILENRGLADLDTPLSESRFSNYFDGWVDEHRVEHDEHDAVQASIEDHEDHDEPFEEEEEDDENQSEIDDEGEADANQNEDEEEQEDQDDQEDDDDVDATVEQTAEVEEEDNDEDHDNDDDEDNDENNTIEQTIEDNRNSIEDEGDDENDGDNDNNGGEVDDNDDDNDNDNDDDVDDDDDANIKPSKQYSTNAAANNDDDDDDDDIFDEDDDDDDDAFDSFDNVVDNDAEELLLLQQKAARQAAEAAQNQQSSHTNNNDDDDDDDNNEVEPPSSSSWAKSLAVKIGVGVALALVARLVLIRKNPNTIEEPTAEMLMKRRYTMATSDEQIPEDDDEEPTPLEDEYSEEEVEIEEEIEVYDNDDDVEIDETNDDIAISGNYVPETFEQLQALYRPKESHVEILANKEILGSKQKMPAVFNAPPPPPTPLIEPKINATTATIVTKLPVATPTNEEEPKHTPSVDRNREIAHDLDYNEDEDDDDIDYDEDEDEENEAGIGDGQGDISDEESYEIDIDDNEISDVDDTELMNRLEAKYGRLPAKEFESDEDPDDPTWTQINPKQPSNGGPQTHPGQEFDNGDDDDDNAEDENDAAAFELFEQELLRANAHMMEEKNYPIALKEFALLTQKYSHIPEAFLGQAKALDRLAEAQHSNKLLNEAIEAYKRYLAFDNVITNDSEFREAAERCIERMRFMGYHQQAVVIHEQLIERFNNESTYHNQLSLTYLMLNRLTDVKRISQVTLRRWPTDGLANLHFGLALKQLEGNRERAAYFMLLGINSNATGTQEGFYYLTLGEMLERMDRVQEAMEIFERGAQLKLFPSSYQRSLYNEPHLRAQPYWSAKETGYGLQLTKFEHNWQAIRDEALALLSRQGYFVNEAENLRDKGNWQQFELYARGQRQHKNCQKAPITCGIIAQFSAASGCKRGQVKFSVLHADSHIWPHCGPTNCRLRAHLGLVVPKGTRLRVVQEERTWSEGKFLIFDDSFEHEVWHNGTSLRLVLIVDIWHPDLSNEQRQALTAI